MRAAPRISEAEWQVMKVIWSRPPSTAQEIIEALAATSEWSPATIKTLLNRLVKKGALSFEKEGKSYRYAARASEEVCRQAETESFLERVFNGSLTPMVAHFVNAKKLTAEQKEELRRLLREDGK